MIEKHPALGTALDIGLFLTVSSMLLTKGEGLTDVLLFGTFALWLFAGGYRNNLHVLKNHISILFFAALGTILFSVIFSLDPIYSLKEFLKEPVKALVFFILLATTISDEAKVRILLGFMFGAAVIVVAAGYFSYIFLDLDRASPDTLLLHAHPNRFSKYLNIFLSFISVLYFVWKGFKAKTTVIALLLASLLAIVLSGSRGGLGSVLAIASVWGIYLWRKEGLSVIAMLSAVAVIIVSIGILSWSSPYVRNKIYTFPEHVRTMTGRTSFWESAFYAFKERPVFGWGYGKKIFNMEEPYKKSGSKIPPLHPHNTFVKVLFHQGIVGFVPYLLLLIFSIIHFWKGSLKSSGINSYILSACVAAIIGEFLLHSMLEILRLHYLAMIIGIGLAVTHADKEESVQRRGIYAE